MSRPLHLPDTDDLELIDAKQALRAAVRTHRSARSAKARQEAAQSFARHGLEAVGEANCVACFVSTGAEPDTTLLLDALRAAGIRVLLPVLGPGLERSWGEYRGPKDLQVRAPGRPPEPAGPALDPGEIATAQAIDRALLRRGEDVPVFAMVHEAELLADVTLPLAEHDVQVDAVITEERWFLLKGSPFQSAAQRDD